MQKHVDKGNLEAYNVHMVNKIKNVTRLGGDSLSEEQVKKVVEMLGDMPENRGNAAIAGLMAGIALGSAKNEEKEAEKATESKKAVKD